MLLNMSIKDNLMLGKPDASDAQIHSALVSSMAYEFISQFPENVDLMVGNSGGQLSGG